MSTMKNIEQVISQIMHDTDTYKPDLYCAEDVFQEIGRQEFIKNKNK